MQMFYSLWLLPLSLWSQHCSAGCPHSQMRLKYRHASVPLNNSQNKDSTTTTPPLPQYHVAAVSQDICLFIISESHLTLMHLHHHQKSLDPNTPLFTVIKSHLSLMHLHQKSLDTNAPSFTVIKSHLTLIHLHSPLSKFTWQ